MYEIGTILARKEKLGTRRDPNPYDEVKVLGISPKTVASLDGTWSGAGKQSIIIQPCGVAYGATIDLTEEQIKEHYDIKFIPDPPNLVREIRIPVKDSSVGESPEDVFRRIAEEEIDGQ